MPEGQKDIYYLTGDSREIIRALALSGGLSQPRSGRAVVDGRGGRVSVSGLREYKGKALKAADRGELEGDKAEQEQKEVSETSRDFWSMSSRRWRK